jgi:hypothetical protein
VVLIAIQSTVIASWIKAKVTHSAVVGLLGACDVFPEIYIEKEQIAVHKNDQDMRKSPGNITCVRALNLKTCKEDHI